MILITGATGNVGSELAKRLAADGIPVRAMVRTAAAAERLLPLDGIVPVVGDFDDPASLMQALDGIERAFLLTNSSEKAEAQQMGFVDAARRAGVRHIVKLSQLHAAPNSPVRFLRYHAAVERAIRASGLAYTFLRPNLFMQGLLGFRHSIDEQGRFFGPIEEARVSLIDTRDIAAVAAATLTEQGHENRVYDLTGPEALSHAEIALQMSDVLGREISFVSVPPETMREALLGLGFPAWQASGLLEDYAHYARGEAAAVSDGVALITGSAPRSFGSFLRNYWGR